MRRRQRLIPSAILMLLLFASFASNAVAATPSSYVSLVTKSTPVTFTNAHTHASVTYQMTISADENTTSGNTDPVNLTLDLQRTVTGVHMKATQEHSYSFSIDRSSFTFAGNLTSGSFDSGTQLTSPSGTRSFGRISLSLSNAVAGSPTCGGHLTSSTGTISGTVSFNPNERYIGTPVHITTLPSAGGLVLDTGCSSGAGCPALLPTSALSGNTTSYQLWEMDRFSKNAVESYTRGYGVAWLSSALLTASVSARVPKSNITLTDPPVTITTVAGTFFTGSATWTTLVSPASSAGTCKAAGIHYVTSTQTWDPSTLTPGTTPLTAVLDTGSFPVPPAGLTGQVERTTLT